METKKKRSFFGAFLRSLIFGQREMNSIYEEEIVQSPTKTIARNFFKRRLTKIGLVVFLTLFFACFILPIFFPLDLRFFDSSMHHRPPGRSMMNYDRALRGNTAGIAAGSGFGVGISNDGDVYTWGPGDAFGAHDVPGPYDERAFSHPRGMGRIVQIDAGENHVVALNAHGFVFTWGNTNFNLPDVPNAVQGSAVQVVAGTNYSIVVTNDGNVHVWGNRMATGSNIFPRNLRGHAEYVAANATGVLVLLEGGYVQHLGRNPDVAAHVFENIPDEIQGRVTSLALTDRNGGAVLNDGSVVVWGSEIEYAANVPEEIGNRATDIVAGRGHFTALLNDGTVVSWGNNYYGQASSPNLRNIASISAGFHHNYAIDAQGNIHTWGLRGFIFGSDGLGRCVFRRTISGGRLTMTVGVIAVVISAIIGFILGGFAGYFGGRVDWAIMRFSEIWSSIPFIPLAIILIHILGNDVSDLMRIIIVMVVLGVLNWPGLMRMVRGQIFQVREMEYVMAARTLGVNEYRIIFKHIFPNIMSVLTVWLALNLAGSMLTESGLSFIGFGVTEPTPTWGNMLSAATQSTVIRDFWWRWVFPAIAITLAAVSINLIGDGLREAIDPKELER